MTEADWLVCTDPVPMLDFLRGRAGDRKLRLFACAWSYDLWRRMPDDRCREAITTAERFADGEASFADLLAAHRDAADAWREVPLDLGGRHEGRRLRKGSWAAKRAAEVARHAADPEWDARAAAHAVSRQGGATRYALATHLRDIFAPFRVTVIEPAWLTSTVVALAREAYESRDFSLLPILADALQDARCEDDEVLNHCRGERPHVRGCWVIDLLLGKA
jgi:hypothetical protein